MSAAAYVSSDLQEQRRFSDSGIAADEYDHPGQRTAAEHTVEFFNAGRQALSLISTDLSDRYGPCRGPLTPTPVAVGFHRRAFFDEATPLLTLGAPPKPFAALVATALANVYRANLSGHYLSPGR